MGMRVWRISTEFDANSDLKPRAVSILARRRSIETDSNDQEDVLLFSAASKSDCGFSKGSTLYHYRVLHSCGIHKTIIHLIHRAIGRKTELYL